MKNKRGWLRIIEAFLAVLILLSAVLIIMSKQDVVEDSSEEIMEVQTRILEMISRNDSLREEIVVNEDKVKVGEEILLMLPKNLDFRINICDVNYACGSEGIPYDKNVYAKEILITSTLDEYNPKKLRFFVWER